MCLFLIMNIFHHILRLRGQYWLGKSLDHFPTKPLALEFRNFQDRVYLVPCFQVDGLDTISKKKTFKKACSGLWSRIYVGLGKSRRGEVWQSNYVSVTAKASIFHFFLVQVATLFTSFWREVAWENELRKRNLLLIEVLFAWKHKNGLLLCKNA